MKPVAFPLQPGTRGQPLVDQKLQGALHFLIDKGLLPLTEADRNVYSAPYGRRNDSSLTRAPW